MFETLFSLIVLVVVLGGLIWYGSRKTALTMSPHSKQTSRPYTKPETAHLRMLERRLAEAHVSNEFGPDYDQWGVNALRVLNTEDVQRLKEWYGDAYFELNQKRILETEQVTAKGWISTALVLLARIEGRSCETPNGETAESAHNTAS